jgi:hypothetical protein
VRDPVHTRKIGNTQKDENTPKRPKDRRGARTDGDATAKRTGAQPSEHLALAIFFRATLANFLSRFLDSGGQISSPIFEKFSARFARGQANVTTMSLHFYPHYKIHLSNNK